MNPLPTPRIEQLLYELRHPNNAPSPRVNLGARCMEAADVIDRAMTSIGDYEAELEQLRRELAEANRKGAEAISGWATEKLEAAKAYMEANRMRAALRSIHETTPARSSSHELAANALRGADQPDEP